jgi:hypothetical protein
MSGTSAKGIYMIDEINTNLEIVECDNSSNGSEILRRRVVTVEGSRMSVRCFRCYAMFANLDFSVTSFRCGVARSATS